MKKEQGKSKRELYEEELEIRKSKSHGTRGRKKRRSGGRIFLTVLLVCVLIGIVVFSVSMFFYVNEIVVTGNKAYTTEEILETVNIKHEENMFKIKTSDIKNALLSKYQYIQSVTVSKKLPSTIEIKIEETKAECQIKTPDKLLLLNKNLKILEKKEQSEEFILPFLEGVRYNGEEVGNYIAEESAIKKQAIVDILFALENHGLLEKIKTINVSDEFYITMDYDGRIEVRLGNYSKIEEKMDFFNAIKDRIHESDGGVLDISDTEKAPFISKR